MAASKVVECNMEQALRTLANDMLHLHRDLASLEGEQLPTSPQKRLSLRLQAKELATRLPLIAVLLDGFAAMLQ